MASLTEFMPEVSKTVEAIYGFYKTSGDAEPQRGYLGASIIGEECSRRLWYTFRGVAREDFDGRMYRLFETGDLEEERIVANLRAIGCEVWDKDANGEQFGVSLLGGHFSGHMDAVVLGVPEAPKTPHVGEFKTSNEKHFVELEKKGVRAVKPLHYAQMQAYMGGFGLTRALYVARNKNTDALYSERVNFDPDFYKALVAKAKRVIEATKPPERAFSRPDDWRCKFCPAAKLCWGTPDVAVPIAQKACKSCVHATPLTDGEGARWRCDKYEQEVDPAVGAECPSHLLLPGLVSFAEPTDSEDGSIEFTNAKGGAVWLHGNAAGQWTTAELMASRGPLDGTPKPDPMTGVAATSATPPSQQPTSFASTVTTSPSEIPCGYRCHFECCASKPVPLPCGMALGHDGNCACAPDLALDENLLAIEIAKANVGGTLFGEDPKGLLNRYPWQDSERVWDGQAFKLESALAEFFGSVPDGEPHAEQDDAQVNAAEFHRDDGDYLIVLYKQDDHAAIWRGKS